MFKKSKPQFISLICDVIEYTPIYVILKPIKSKMTIYNYDQLRYKIRLDIDDIIKAKFDPPLTDRVAIAAHIVQTHADISTYKVKNLYNFQAVAPDPEPEKPTKTLGDLMMEIALDEAKKKGNNKDKHQDTPRFPDLDKKPNSSKSENNPTESDPLSDIEDMYAKRREIHGRQTSDTYHYVNIFETYREFLSTHTPELITKELDERIIGQSELTRQVGDFIYYHILRQLHTDLPPRPMLISGPSGSGKTEVWRVAQRLYSQLLKIEIVDGASMTSEGWKGDNKLSSHINEDIADGGVLIIDEFDKLAIPRFDSGGANVAIQTQSEFLKLLEGEYEKQVRGRVFGDSSRKIETVRMGIVLIGAFENIREIQRNTVGFSKDNISKTIKGHITDEEYIKAGVIPELVGRVSIKCTTNELTDAEYLMIVKNKHSRVSLITNVLKGYNIELEDIINDNEILSLIKNSKSNKTGVRWVSAQIENKMLGLLREKGIGDIRRKKDEEKPKEKTPSESDLHDPLEDIFTW